MQNASFEYILTLSFFMNFKKYPIKANPAPTKKATINPTKSITIATAILELDPNSP